MSRAATKGESSQEVSPPQGATGFRPAGDLGGAMHNVSHTVHPKGHKGAEFSIGSSPLWSRCGPVSSLTLPGVHSCQSD